MGGAAGDAVWGVRRGSHISTAPATKYTKSFLIILSLNEHRATFTHTHTRSSLVYKHTHVCRAIKKGYVSKPNPGTHSNTHTHTVAHIETSSLA